MTDFTAFPKMARMSREMIVTEKIDGTNGCIFIGYDGEFLVGSRSRWLTKEADNFGFHRWATENKEQLMQLGPGRHFGEWWGSGIQRGYDLPKGEKRFSLFNVSRWIDARTALTPGDKQEFAPYCCHVVPILHFGCFDTAFAEGQLTILKANGSVASPGFMNPEGIIVWHTAGNFGLKKTIDKDDQPKGQS